MKATPKRRKCVEVRYYGTSRRLKVHVYTDGTGRLHYRRMNLKKLWAGQKTAWEFCGEFPLSVAEHLAETFHGVIDERHAEVERERRAALCPAN